MLREMSTRYGRSPGGYLWAVIEPVAAILVLAVVFSLLLRAPPLGNSFILFYAAGYLPFMLSMTLTNTVQFSLFFSKPLLFYPIVSWIDAVFARIVLNTLTGIVVLIVTFAIILQVVSVTAIFEFLPMIGAVLLMVLLGAGFGVLNCVLVGFFPVWQQLWGVATRPLFLASGIIFIFENLPPTLQSIAWYLPWIHGTALFRTGVYPTYQPEWISIPLVLAWALIPMFFGLLLLRRHYRDILNR